MLKLLLFCNYVHIVLLITHTDFFPSQTQNSVYEIVSDVNSRQDIMEERLTCLEEKLSSIQLSLEMLPDLLSRYHHSHLVSWGL